MGIAVLLFNVLNLYCLVFSGVSGEGSGVTVEGNAPAPSVATPPVADSKVIFINFIEITMSGNSPCLSIFCFFLCNVVRIVYQASAADEDDDDDVDLFGEETEEEKKAAEQRAAAIKKSASKKECEYQYSSLFYMYFGGWEETHFNLVLFSLKLLYFAFAACKSSVFFYVNPFYDETYINNLYESFIIVHM